SRPTLRRGAAVQPALARGVVRPCDRREQRLCGIAEAVEAAVALRPEAAASAAEGLLGLAAGHVPLFFAPAAQGWARTAVESRISRSRSGSRSAARIGSHRPASAQRSNRRQT